MRALFSHLEDQKTVPDGFICMREQFKGGFGRFYFANPHFYFAKIDLYSHKIKIKQTLIVVFEAAEEERVHEVEARERAAAAGWILALCF